MDYLMLMNYNTHDNIKGRISDTYIPVHFDIQFEAVKYLKLTENINK